MKMHWIILAAACMTLSAAAEILKIGEPAPAFSGTDTHGKAVALSDFAGKIVVLEWTNPGCPFVKKHYSSKNMQNLQKTYTEKGVVWLTICSSAPGKQGNYSADEWNKMVTDKGIASTAVIPDADGTIGHAYGASNTPHMFVIGPDGKLVYEGAIDNKNSTEIVDVHRAKNYVAAALDETLAGKPVSEPLTQPYGCGVKY